MRLYFFDNSVLGRICFRRFGTCPSNSLSNWEKFLDEMERYHPNFVETPFLWVRSPSVYLEVIGLGKVRLSLKNQVRPDEWKSFSHLPPEQGATEFLKSIEKRIRAYIHQTIPANFLYRKTTVEFLREFACHANSNLIASIIKRWAKNIRNPKHYKAFVENIIWDTLTRYPFINLKIISKSERLHAMKLWAGIMGILSAKYIEARENGLEFSALGLFAEVHKVVGCFNSPDFHKKYDILLGTWDDMADADAIHFSLLGYHGQPVNVLTMDKPEDLKRRLQCFSENLKALSENGYEITFLPGTILVFSRDFQTVEFINVREFLKIENMP